ncbi:MAG: hypothetical protein ABJC62_05965 [Frankiaceae bacterium]
MTGPDLNGEGQPAPAEGTMMQCNCLASDSDEAAYLAYGVGLAECEKYLAEVRSECPVHGVEARIS